MAEIPKEPTGEQCSANCEVFRRAGKVGYAIWYPQMGGYVGKAVAVVDEKWSISGDVYYGGCVDVYVWHDGEFPFSETDESPRLIHHCDPEQFINFGRRLTELNNNHMVEENE